MFFIYQTKRPQETKPINKFIIKALFVKKKNKTRRKTKKKKKQDEEDERVGEWVGWGEKKRKKSLLVLGVAVAVIVSVVDGTIDVGGISEVVKTLAVVAGVSMFTGVVVVYVGFDIGSLDVVDEVEAEMTFYFILFYFILFYFMLGYFILFYFTLVDLLFVCFFSLWHRTISISD